MHTCDVFDVIHSGFLTTRDGYGPQVILLFKCKVSVHQRRPEQTREKTVAFVEELWPFATPERKKDLLQDEFDCKRLYRTSPEPTYYVIDLWRVIGDNIVMLIFISNRPHMRQQ